MEVLEPATIIPKLVLRLALDLAVALASSNLRPRLSVQPARHDHIVSTADERRRGTGTPSVVASHAAYTAPSAFATSPSFGALLKRYRRAAGLTQEALAERAGYSVGHISKLESSVRLPVPATVELLADALALGSTERAALAHAAHRGGTSARDLALPSPKTQLPLIGRHPQERGIEQHLRDDAPTLLLFTGEPGIGKSRLLQAAATLGASTGWFVVQGTCRRSSVHSPFDPLLDALAGAAHRMESAELRSALDGCSWLTRLMPELAEVRGVPMPAWSLPADQERRLMFTAVGRFLRNIAGPAGTLLVLDNLQSAGADALDLLSTLVAAAPRVLLRVIGAYRPNDVRPGDPLDVLTADLAREGHVAQQSIGPLTQDAAAELLDVLLAGADHVDTPTRDAVLRRAAGVPFVLVSYAHWLRSPASNDSAARDSAARKDLGIPTDVTQAVMQRVAALPEAAQMVVRIAAVSEGDDTRELLTVVARQLGYTEGDIVAAIDGACAAGLLVERGDDLYGFDYDLTQEVIERNLGAAQRAFLHSKIAEALSDAHNPPRLEALAAHYTQAGEPEKAILFVQRAGAKANALHAYAGAEGFYRFLADHLDGHGPAKEAVRAREQSGVMLEHMGRHTEALAALEQAWQEYQAGGWPDEQARVAARIGAVYGALGEVDHGIARLEREISAAVGFSNRGMAALHMALAQLYRSQGAYAHELASAEHAADLARAAADPHLLALAEMERGTALAMADRLGESLHVLEDAAVPLSAASGDLWLQALALDRAAYGRILRGEFAAAKADIERGIALGRQLDDPLVAGLMTLNRGILDYYTGAWHQARTDLRRATALLQSLPMPPSRTADALVWRGRLSLAQGDRERADYNITRGLAVAEHSVASQSLILAQCALAERDLVEKHPDAARLRLEPLLAGEDTQMSDVTEALSLLGWAHLELGDGRQSETLVAASAIRASTTGLRCALADVLRIQALLLAREEHWPDALSAVTDALALAHELSYPYAEAKARHVYGQLLLQRGESEHASQQLSEALTILNRLGERMYAGSISQLNAAM